MIDEREKPNIFSFGTGELTHDAILAWCLAWGEHKENPLYNLSKELLKLLTGTEIQINKIDIFLEKYNIDILAIVNDEIVVVIEDKIDTYARIGQLEKYKKIIEKKYSDKKRFYSYVTIGDESNYEKILNQDYRVVERKDLLTLVRKYKEHSEILNNYYRYLLEKEESFNSYKRENLNEWTSRGWQGFFKEELTEKIEDGGWSPVVNQKGGFQAFYWDNKEYKYDGKIPYIIYLQVEACNRDRFNDKIAFKVRVDDKTYRSEIRNYIYRELISILDESSEIQKPQRFGHGLTMTYAEIKNFKTRKEFFKALELVVDAQEQLHRLLGKN